MGCKADPHPGDVSDDGQLRRGRPIGAQAVTLAGRRSSRHGPHAAVSGVSRRASAQRAGARDTGAQYHTSSIVDREVDGSELARVLAVLARR